MFFSPQRRPNVKSSNLIVRACVEALESRRLLAADVWTGAGPDALFSDAANWQGGAVPTSGQDVTFPANAAVKTVTVDTNVVVGNVEFDAAYTLSPPMAANPTITLNGINATAGSTVINNPVVLGQSITALVFGGAGLTLNGVSDGGSAFGITQMGTGVLTLTGGGDTYTGPTNADGGTVDDLTSLTSAVNVSAYSTFNGNGSINSLDGSGGTYGAANGAAAGSVVIASNLNLVANTGNTMDFLIGGPGKSSEFTVNAGTISLGNATFAPTILSSYTPAAGVITLIANNTGTAIVGTFNNLPEGASVTLGSEKYTISYVGGSGHDVTLTGLQSASTTTLKVKKTPILEGDNETITATVTGPAAVHPTGTVNFYENGTLLGSSTLTNQVAVLAVTNLPVGNDVITAAYEGDANYTGSNSGSVTVSVRSALSPVIESVTTPLTTHGFTVGANVYAYDFSSTLLDYSWTAIHLPAGAKPPVFSSNGDSAAQSIIARFSKDGGYILQCTVTDPSENSTTTDVYVTVSQKATTLRIEPHKAHIQLDQPLQYTTTVLDQFGHPMRTPQNLTYAVTSGTASGSINSSGLFFATTVDGAVTIEVEDGLLTGTVGAEVI